MKGLPNHSNMSVLQLSLQLVCRKAGTRVIRRICRLCILGSIGVYDLFDLRLGEGHCGKNGAGKAKVVCEMDQAPILILID
jgi:hypothetical protein